MNTKVRKRPGPAAVPHAVVGERLAAIPGVAEGLALQQQVIQLGDKLRTLRERFLELNQTEAAQLIGLPQSELSRIEAGIGRRGPSYATVARILSAYEARMATHGQSLALTIQVRDVSGRTDDVSLLAAGSMRLPDE